MTVEVKYFASLRETIGRDSDMLTIGDPTTVEEIWNLATAHMQRPDSLLVAVNQEYADLSQTVRDGDEVAFFPPVTGG
jgi:molybdopterin synthase sulfur carrier subunit